MVQSPSPPGARAVAKEKRRNKIIACALELFYQHGMENTSMEQIASAAEIGSATIYRYFPTKSKLLADCMIYVWEQKIDRYFPRLQQESYRNATGKEQLSVILDLFTDLAMEDPGFFRLLQMIDHTIENGLISGDDLVAYEKLFAFFQEHAVHSLQKGLQDHSLSFTSEPVAVYFTVFHTMLSTTQKLVLQGDLLQMDQLVPAKTQLTLLKEILLKGLSD